MNKPVNPPKTPQQQDGWISIGSAAAEVIRKLADKQGKK